MPTISGHSATVRVKINILSYDFFFNLWLTKSHGIEHIILQDYKQNALQFGFLLIFSTKKLTSNSFFAQLQAHYMQPMDSDRFHQDVISHMNSINILKTGIQCELQIISYYISYMRTRCTNIHIVYWVVVGKWKQFLLHREHTIWFIKQINFRALRWFLLNCCFSSLYGFRAISLTLWSMWQSRATIPHHAILDSFRFLGTFYSHHTSLWIA